MGFSFLKKKVEKDIQIKSPLNDLLKLNYRGCKILDVSETQTPINIEFNNNRRYQNSDIILNFSLNVEDFFPDGKIVVGEKTYQQSIIKDCIFSIKFLFGVDNRVGNLNMDFNRIELVDRVYITRGINQSIYDKYSSTSYPGGPFNSNLSYFNFDNQIISTISLYGPYKISYNKVFLDYRDIEYMMSELSLFIKDSIINQFLEESLQIEKLIEKQKRMSEFKEKIDDYTIKEYFCSVIDYFDNHEIVYDDYCTYSLTLQNNVTHVTDYNNHSTSGLYPGFYINIDDNNSNMLIELSESIFRFNQNFSYICKINLCLNNQIKITFGVK